MVKQQVKNPLATKASNRMVVRGSTAHNHIKYLLGLRKLNTTNEKIKNPSGKGKPILVFGLAHIKYLYSLDSPTQEEK